MVSELAEKADQIYISEVGVGCGVGGQMGWHKETEMVRNQKISRTRKPRLKKSTECSVCRNGGNQNKIKLKRNNPYQGSSLENFSTLRRKKERSRKFQGGEQHENTKLPHS